MAEVGLNRGASLPSAKTALGWVLKGEVALAVGVIGIITLLITLKVGQSTVSPQQVEQIISETVERTVQQLKFEPDEHH